MDSICKKQREDPDDVQTAQENMLHTVHNHIGAPENGIQQEPPRKNKGRDGKKLESKNTHIILPILNTVHTLQLDMSHSDM